MQHFHPLPASTPPFPPSPLKQHLSPSPKPELRPARRMIVTCPQHTPILILRRWLMLRYGMPPMRPTLTTGRMSVRGEKCLYTVCAFRSCVSPSPCPLLRDVAQALQMDLNPTFLKSAEGEQELTRDSRSTNLSLRVSLPRLRRSDWSCTAG